MTSVCSSGCDQPGQCESWGQCVRRKGLKIAYANSAAGWDYSKEKRFRAENEAYRDAVAQGLQPKSVTFQAVREAEHTAEKG